MAHQTDFIEFIKICDQGDSPRYVVRTQSGLEITLVMARRWVRIRFNPNRMDMDVLPDGGGYRFFGVTHAPPEQSEQSEGGEE